MAFTQVPVGLRPRIWSKESWRQITFESPLGHFLNSGVIYRPREFEGTNQKGQEMIYSYTGKIIGPGVGRGGTMTGNEKALDIGNFTMKYDLVRQAVLNPNEEDTIEAAETDYEFEAESREALTIWHMEQLGYSLFNQLAGNTATTMTLGGTTYTGAFLGQVTGSNDIIAPSTNRIILAGNVANDQSLTPANRMTLQLVDYARELMRNSTQQIGRLKTGFLGELWISEEQFTDLKQDVDSPIQWYLNAQAMAAGGDSSQLTGKDLYRNQVTPVGAYGGIEIFVSPYVSFGVNSSNNAQITTVRRAVLVGRDALSYASRVGRGRATDRDVPIVFKEQLNDYGYYKGIEARRIMGIKKNTPSNGSDIGVVVISTYAAAHV